MFRLALIASSALLTSLPGAAQDLASNARLGNFEGPAVAMLLDATAICVPRRHLTTDEAKAFSELRHPDGAPRRMTPARVRATMFLPHFGGYTDELYLDYARSRYRARDASWIEVDLMTASLAAFHRSDSEPQDFESETYVDSLGLVSRRARADCAGKTFGFGAGFIVTTGPDCLLEEYKEARFEGSSVHLHCKPTSNVCYTRTVVESSGLFFRYGFQMGQLSRWAEIHAGIRSTLRRWTEDATCQF